MSERNRKKRRPGPFARLGHWFAGLWAMLRNFDRLTPAQRRRTVLLCALPLLLFGTALADGLRHGLCLWLALFAAAVFALTLPVYYNESAWVYAPAYGLVTLAGSGLGALVRRLQKRG